MYPLSYWNMAPRRRVERLTDRLNSGYSSIGRFGWYPPTKTSLSYRGMELVEGVEPSSPVFKTGTLPQRPLAVSNRIQQYIPAGMYTYSRSSIHLNLLLSYTSESLGPPEGFEPSPPPSGVVFFQVVKQLV